MGAALAVAVAALAWWFWPEPLDRPRPVVPSVTESPPAPEPPRAAVETAPAGSERVPGDATAAEPEPDAPERSKHRVVGRVTRAGVAVAGARIEVIAGIDRGTATVSDAAGDYVLAAMHPDAAVLACTVGHGVVAERRLAVRHDAETRCDLDLTPGTDLVGKVADAAGRPVVGATVRCDGQQAISDPTGAFLLRRTASGNARVLVAAEGFAPLERPAWSAREASLVLERGCVLELTLPPLGRAGDVHVYVLPADTERAAAWPGRWPVVARAGATAVLRDLPRADVEVRAFHASAAAEPVAANLRPDAVARATLAWSPLPVVTGRVVDPEPVAGAAVEIAAGDAHEATALALGHAQAWMRLVPMDAVPAARQQLLTDAAGRFRGSLPAVRHGGVFVSASLGGRRVRRRLVAGADTIELVLPR